MMIVGDNMSALFVHTFGVIEKKSFYEILTGRHFDDEGRETLCFINVIFDGLQLLLVLFQLVLELLGGGKV